MLFDQATRSVWLADQLWPSLREAFPELKRLPHEVLITVGYPSSGARGRSEKIKPCEVNYQWRGNENEKAFLSIHPVYFDSPINAAKALLFGCAKAAIGARWGPRHVGISKDDTGTLTAEPETQAKLEKVLANIGEPPAGFGLPFPVRDVQRTRLRRYEAKDPFCLKDAVTGDSVKHPIIRAASDTLSVSCNTCGVDYKLA